MPISPIDFISIAPKSQEVSHVQAGHDVRQEQANVAVHTQFQQQVEHNSRQTVRKANADHEEYRYDAKEKGNHSGQRRKKNAGKQGEKQKAPKHFDMKF